MFNKDILDLFAHTPKTQTTRVTADSKQGRQLMAKQTYENTNKFDNAESGHGKKETLRRRKQLFNKLCNEPTTIIVV